MDHLIVHSQFFFYFLIAWLFSFAPHQDWIESIMKIRDELYQDDCFRFSVQNQEHQLSLRP